MRIPKAVIYREPSFVGVGKSFAIGTKVIAPLTGASSLLVLPGYNAKLCTSAGTGSGAGTCQTFTASTDQLPVALNDSVGYLETWASPVIVRPPPIR